VLTKRVFLTRLRKSYSIFFLIVYLFALNSWSASLHYCGKDIVSVSVSETGSKDCCCDNMKCDCCDDKEVKVKSHDKHQLSSKVTYSQADICYVITTGGKLSFGAIIKSYHTKIYHIPPLLSQGQIYLRNGVLLI
jgi:hypothetical protein